MKITPIEITVGELVAGFQDNGDEGGVVAYGGKLDVRPPYQRAFVYTEKQQKSVITSVMFGFPLNVMYWAKVEGEDRFEILDGQQRTLSLANFAGVPIGFPIEDPLDNDRHVAFHNLSKERKEAVLSYPLTVYVCEGTSDQKLAWFKTINIAGEVLTEQELRNAAYHGPWTAKAKKHFSGKNPPAGIEAKGLVKVRTNRQELLELAIKWVSDGHIEKYMSTHQHDTNANEIILHFKRVIDWAKATFPHERSLREKVDWGSLYRRHEATVPQPDPDRLEKEIATLIMDDEVTNKAGIYAYVLDRDERHLHIRKFSDKVKLETYTKQRGVCPMCDETFTLSEMEGDHIIPWSKGGETVASNCQMLCVGCNGSKGNKGNRSKKIRADLT